MHSEKNEQYSVYNDNFFGKLGRIDGQQGTVLIIDSDRASRQRAREILRGDGFVVYTASDGYQAQNILLMKNDKIDLCLLDPDIQGKPSGQFICELMQTYPEIKIAIYRERRIHDINFVSLVDANKIPILAKPFFPETITGFVRKIVENNKKCHEI